jgi:hypothetical protein
MEMVVVAADADGARRAHRCIKCFTKEPSFVDDVAVPHF